MKITDHLEGSGQEWKENIEIDLKEKVCEDLNGIHLALGRNHLRAVANMAINTWIP
jgi:hypothetical protein